MNALQQRGLVSSIEVLLEVEDRKLSNQHERSVYIHACVSIRQHTLIRKCSNQHERSVKQKKPYILVSVLYIDINKNIHTYIYYITEGGREIDR